MSLSITRLSFNKGELKTVAGETVATWRLFRPDRSGAVSVFRIDGLDEQGIWGHADEYFDRVNQTMRGRGDFAESDIEGTDLTFTLDETPPRHGEITGWPERGTPLHKEVAENLASECKGVLRPEQSG
ncbi:hypothetical protein [Candidatus Palauibacter sp.]|uniref:hypothetical protein n=1 Tax=Candidatus Palauibacter sp. TaxID=3101350 RepID=UPI003C6F2F8E